MIDYLWVLLLVVLVVGLWAAALWDLHLQNERCRRRRKTRHFEMRLPDHPKFDLARKS